VLKHDWTRKQEKYGGGKRSKARTLFVANSIKLIHRVPNQETLEGFENFKLGGKVMRSVKYAEEIVLQLKNKRYYKERVIDKRTSEDAVELKGIWKKLR
jgi:hypothetical protein